MTEQELHNSIHAIDIDEAQKQRIWQGIQQTKPSARTTGGGSRLLPMAIAFCCLTALLVTAPTWINALHTAAPQPGTHPVPPIDIGDAANSGELAELIAEHDVDAYNEKVMLALLQSRLLKESNFEKYLPITTEEEMLALLQSALLKESNSEKFSPIANSPVANFCFDDTYYWLTRGLAQEDEVGDLLYTFEQGDGSDPMLYNHLLYRYIGNPDINAVVLPWNGDYLIYARLDSEDYDFPAIPDSPETAGD